MTDQDLTSPERIWIEAAPQFPEKIPPFPSWNDDEADPSMNQTVEYVRADLCTPTDERVKALETENAQLREALEEITNRAEFAAKYQDDKFNFGWMIRKSRAALRDMGDGNAK